MSADEFKDRGRSIMLKRNNLVKWGFYSVVFEQLFEYIDYDKTNTCSVNIPTIGTSNKSLAFTIDTLLRGVLTEIYVLWQSTS